VLADIRQHSFRIFENVSIFQPNYSQSKGREKPIPCLVVIDRRLAVVRSPIEFDHQSLCWAIEIDDVGADALLTPEFSAVQAGTLECSPQCRLCRCQVVAERATESQKLT
jgi:hypothetical protein